VIYGVASLIYGKKEERKKKEKRERQEEGQRDSVVVIHGVA